LADDLVEAAWTDWCGRVAAALGPGQGLAIPSASARAGLPALFGRPFSGALVLRIRWLGAPFLIAMGPSLVVGFLERHGPRAPEVRGPAEPLVPVLEAARSLGFRLSVELAPVTIDLGTLATLRLGDTLRISHRIDAPLILAAPDFEEAHGHGLPNACLGRQGPWMAVELLPKPPSPTRSVNPPQNL
jgi:hypothetical protein